MFIFLPQPRRLTSDCRNAPKTTAAAQCTRLAVARTHEERSIQQRNGGGRRLRLVGEEKETECCCGPTFRQLIKTVHGMIYVT